MPEHSFHPHIYFGRESGLMLVGTAESLRKLATELENAVSEEQSSPNNWPREVAVLNTVSPYSDREDFRISVHLATSTLPQELLRKARSGGASLTFIATVGSLAVIGAASLLNLLWKAL